MELAMPQQLFDTPELKQLLKQAFTETLIEQRDVLRDVLVEALEDIALAESIRQGQETPLIDRETVFALFDQTK
jgi:hypothetical protein